MRLPHPSDAVVRRLSLAALVVNVGIVVTGAAVRLTGSGLGCPTWPRCTDASYVAQGELGVHGLIEFGNRTLTSVVGITVLAVLAATALRRPWRRDWTLLAAAMLLGVVGQIVLGGITVLLDLHPVSVAAHFLVSMGLIAAAVALHVRVRQGNGPARAVVAPAILTLGRLLVGVTALTLVLGTVVTGTGPHSGDENAQRLPFDEQTVSRLHADSVFLLVGLAVATVFALHATGAPIALRRRAQVLLAVVLAQGAIGGVQYVTGLPTLLVAAHVLGATLVWVAALRVLLGMRDRAPLPTAPSPALADHAVGAGSHARAAALSA